MGGSGGRDDADGSMVLEPHDPEPVDVEMSTVLWNASELLWAWDPTWDEEIPALAGDMDPDLVDDCALGPMMLPL